MNEPTPEQLAKLPKWASQHIILTEQQRDINRALSWQSYEKPKLFPANTIAFPALKRLWFQNNNGIEWRVEEGCSNGSTHSRSNTSDTTSQGAGAGYETRLESLKACRCDMALKFAIALAKIDAEIIKESGK